jgi:hypothetical protein
MGSAKPRDVYLAGKSDGQMLVTLSENEDTPNNAKVNYLLETLGIDRAKVPRGMKPDYLQIGIKNVSGADFDLDSVEILPRLTRRKIMAPCPNCATILFSLHKSIQAMVAGLAHCWPSNLFKQ